MVVLVVYNCLAATWFLVLQTSTALWPELDPVLYLECYVLFVGSALALYARNEQYESTRKLFKEFWVRCKMTNAYSLVGLDLGKRPQPTETEVNLKMRNRK